MRATSWPKHSAHSALRLLADQAFPTHQGLLWPVPAQRLSVGHDPESRHSPALLSTSCRQGYPVRPGTHTELINLLQIMQGSDQAKLEMAAMQKPGGFVENMTELAYLSDSRVAPSQSQSLKLRHFLLFTLAFRQC